MTLGQNVAVFGWAQWESVLSGNGSGAARGGKDPSILEALKDAGLQPVEELAVWYREEIDAYNRANPPEFDFSKVKEAVNSGLMYEIFGKYTPNPPEFTPSQELLAQAARKAPTALWVLGRKSGGEECDRHLESDFILSAQETALLESICAHFEKVVVVLNTNGLLDLSWAEEHPQVKSLVFLGIPGEEGPAALAELLTGVDQPLGQAQCDHCQERGRLSRMEGLLLGQRPPGVHPYLWGLRPDAPRWGVCTAAGHCLPRESIPGLPVF